MNTHIQLNLFMHKENLKSDGSKFIDLYECLRDILNSNDLLYVIQDIRRRIGGLHDQD
jgi:hypothetical protein